MVLTGLVWLRIGTTGEFFECGNEPSGSIKSWELSSGYTTDGPSSSAQFHRVSDVGFEVSTAVTMKNGVFWDITPCGSCKYRRNFFAASVGCLLQLALCLVHRFLSP
jgi:hypothetical protein